MQASLNGRDDDLQPTYNDDSTITNYRCPDEVMLMASQSSQTGEIGPIALKIFRDRGQNSEGLIEPIQVHSR